MKKVEKATTLLDYWTPPVYGDLSGNSPVSPMGFLCSSFTFDADFFDDECLTRFLAMETEKENDGAAFLIEREEKLAGLNAGIALIDQHHCRGGRSLRWDLVPCRVKQGILHSKIVILHWSHCVRLIIGSANLTKPGYCINKEIFSVFDYYAGSGEDLRLINDALTHLEEIATEQCGETVFDRFNRLATAIRAALLNWKISDRSHRGDEIQVRLLLISPRQRNGLSRLKELWDNRFTSPPTEAYITSPFFDEQETSFSPSVMVPELLKKRGDISVTYQLTGEPVSADSHQLMLHGPSFLQNRPRPNCEIYFTHIDQQGLNEENKPVPRPLHLKTIWLCNDDMNLLVAGSSNFTSAAFGLGKWTNYEANVVFAVSKSRNKTAYFDLCAAHLEGEMLEDENLLFKPVPNEDEPTEEAKDGSLPSFFYEVSIKKWSSNYLLQLSFRNEEPPKGFYVCYKKQDTTEIILTYDQWEQKVDKSKIEIEWNMQSIPDHLLVGWEGNTELSFWPVVAENQVTLPPVDELRNLSLEALFYILSSSQPLHRLLKGIKKVQESKKVTTEDDMAIDVHKMVDTSSYLLQRTRRISYAMRSLRERLEKPVFTEESLKWKLNGPIGIQALIDAITKEAKSSEEKSFLLAELALELSYTRPTETTVSLKASDVRSHIRLFVDFLRSELEKEEIQDSSVKKYSLRGIKKALNEF